MIKLIGTAQKGQEVLLYYYYHKGGYNFFKVTPSLDGFEYNSKSKYVIIVDAKQREEKNYDWKSFRISKQKDNYLLTYKLNTKTYSNLNGALSTDLIRWTKTGKVDDIKETGTVVPDFKYKNKYVMYYGEEKVRIAHSTDLHNWKEEGETLLDAREGYFDDGDIEVGNAFDTDSHILLTYYVKKKADNLVRYFVGAALFDRKDPFKLLWRSDKPVWEHPLQFHHEKMQPLGSVIHKDELILYWLVGESNIYAV